MRGRRTDGTGRLQRVERARAFEHRHEVLLEGRKSGRRLPWRRGSGRAGGERHGQRAAREMPNRLAAREGICGRLAAFLKLAIHLFFEPSAGSFPTSHLCCLSNKLALVAARGLPAALGLPMAPPLGALRVFVQHGTGLRAADLNGLADPYVKLTIRHMTRETRVVHECLDPRWEELVQFIGARRRAPVPRWSCARFPFPARGFPFHEGLFCC